MPHGIPCRIAALLFLLTAVPAAARAQADPPRPGDRVRVTATSASPARVAGRLVRVDADSVVLRPDADQDAPKHFAVAARDVTRLEVSAEPRRHTVLGALVGVVAGGGIGLVSARAGSCGCALVDAQANALGFALGAVVGGAAGAILGHSFPSERWRTVAAPASGTGAALGGRAMPRAGRGMALGLSIATR
ncbi:MAG: hypothetical protein JWM27_948 [Gemmatimonadetes bacterium]|nr:hypothetical protein [Gemmatimonadota bacterium]